jgi:hypothetical protein
MKRGADNREKTQAVTETREFEDAVLRRMLSTPPKIHVPKKGTRKGTG